MGARALLGFVLFLAVGLFANSADADFLYLLETAPGDNGGTVTGWISIPDSFAGDTSFDIADASDFLFETTLGGGLSWGPANLVSPGSGDVGFDLGVGASVLTPVADGDPGFPDWAFREPNNIFDPRNELNLGVDAEPKAIWQVAEIDGATTTFLDRRLGPAPNGDVAWRLVIPEPSALALLAAAAGALVLRRRKKTT